MLSRRPLNDGYDPNDKIYWDLAQNWELAGNLLQTNGGPSFIAHQFLIAGQSGALCQSGYGSCINPWELAENPLISQGGRVSQDIYSTGGCDTLKYDYVLNAYTQPFPTSYTQAMNPTTYKTCNDYETIFDLLDAGMNTVPAWKYYSPAEQLIWSAPIGVSHLYQKVQHLGLGYNFVVDGGSSSGSQLESDVTNGNLAPVSYVIPCAGWSDHGDLYGGGNTGAQWVTWVSNLIGNSPYWSTTTIIVTWDDWGGWYEPVAAKPGIHFPDPYNNASDTYEYGFRVPMLVISPYIAAPGVDNSGPQIPVGGVTYMRTQASILHYIEDSFLLPSLGAADAESDDLMGTLTGNVGNMFNFNQSPRPYVNDPDVPSNTFPAACNGNAGQDNT